jgi:23S rRNA (cytosine1962-C5)-methyltransferase
VACLKAGAARVTNVDSSGALLDAVAGQLACNGLAQARVELINGDVFAVLRRLHTQKRRFDLVILDPPKFVESRAHLEKAARGYKDLNRLGFALLNAEGLLATFSCSGLMPTDLFQKITADAALDAGVSAQIIRRLGPPADHPVALNFPEGDYLKGLICRALGAKPA